MSTVATAKLSSLEELEALDNKFGVFVRYAPHRLRAQIALAEEDFESALYHASLMKNSRSITIQSLELEARIFHLAGRHGEAEKAYHDLLRIFAGHVLSHYNLGVLLQETGRISEAKAELEKFLDAWSDADPGSFWLDDARRRLAACNDELASGS